MSGADVMGHGKGSTGSWWALLRFGGSVWRMANVTPRDWA